MDQTNSITFTPKRERGQIHYETNRSRCHKPHKINPDDPFISNTGETL